MSELVNPMAHNSHCAILLNAMIEAAEKYDIDMSSYFKINYDRTPDSGKVNVQVLVNGEPVPFMEEVGFALKRLVDDFDNIVLEKAVKLINISDVAQQVQQLGRDIEDKLSDVDRLVSVALKKAQDA